MITWPQFCASLEIDVEIVRVWVDEGWIRPRQGEGAALFSDMDLARARLIRDLKDDLGVNHEGVGVILDLLDQVHGLRRVLRGVLDSTGGPPIAPSALRRWVAPAAALAAITAASRRPGSGAATARESAMDFAPGEHEAVAQSGRHLLVRPCRDGDEDALRAMFARASLEDVRFRAFGLDKSFAQNMARRLARIDPANETTLIATAPDARDEVLGAVHLVRASDNPRRAEFDVMVRGDLKGEGIGYRLMLEILSHARQRGIETVDGHILRDNRTMLAMARELGFALADIEDGVVRVKVDLASPRLDAALRAGMPDETPANG